MSASGPNRAERLLNLLQILHRHRYPVSGTRLAEELAIGLRTLYRDIASLRAQGADIRGEAGTGYVLEEGYLLPPMMFSPEQLDALTLGLRWVTHYGDSALSKAAEEAISNIADVLPARLQPYINHSTLLVGPTKTRGGNQNNFSLLRSAVRDESKIRVRYVDLHGEQTERILWPFSLGYLPEEVVLAAWCELHNDFRHFSVARFVSIEMLNSRYPFSRQRLLYRWRQVGRDKEPIQQEKK